jgi:hypothetical protein
VHAHKDTQQQQQQHLRSRLFFRENAKTFLPVGHSCKQAAPFAHSVFLCIIHPRFVRGFFCLLDARAGGHARAAARRRRRR